MRRDIEAARDDVTLSGSVWIPDDTDPDAVVVMHPGSGPSDRDNNGYFVGIRQHLLSSGVAVASFDKRGVGRSGGSWRRAGIEAQAGDLIASSEAVRRLPALEGVPLGIFGHSQGGWVVMEAAGRPFDTGFVIVNSGPGVVVNLQDRYARRRELEAAGAQPGDIADHLARHDSLVELARQDAPYQDVALRRDLDPYLPMDEGDWGLWKEIFDYDPAPAMERIVAPTLAIFGTDDVLVPVPDSVEIFRRHVDPRLLRIEVFADADHRMQVDGDLTLAPGYLETITGFVEAVVSGA